ncbi:MAG: amino acid permease [Actinobacteria bacterium]|nr:amino acid permease [Actinomycetota bacterium]
MATAGGVLGPRKTVEECLETSEVEGFRLKKELGALDIVVFGVGVIVGAGIFVLTGVAAATEAGPSITLSFVFAAVVCALAALCYAEFAAMVPVAGSAYTYSYATLGQFIAFIIGWDLFLEFTVGAAAVAIGWSGQLNATLEQIFGVTLPEAITAPPSEGGVVNLLGMLLVFALTYLLVRGIRISSRANIIMVIVTIAVLLVVIAVGATEVNTANWDPFFPFGFSGVIGGAALVFFAFIGFDIVATTAEEARKPQRDMPRGILGSLAITTVLYVAVALVLTGMLVYSELNTAAPIATAFESADRPWASGFIFAGALIALTNTVLILLLGQSRVAFAMARDRLLPGQLAKTHPRYGTPSRITIIIGVLVAILAGVTPIATAAELVNIGTLFAFMLVSAGILILRRREPDRPRPFRTPGVPIVPILAIVLSAVLIVTLEPLTWLRFLVWMLIGLVVYFLYSRKASIVGQRREAEGGA